MMAHVGEKLVLSAPCPRWYFSVINDGTRLDFMCRVFAILLENVEDGKGDTDVVSFCAELGRHGSNVICLFDFCRDTLLWYPVRSYIVEFSGDLSDGHVCVLGRPQVDAGKLAR